MSAYTNLLAVTLTSAEQSAVAAIGMTGEDSAGVLASVKVDLQEMAIKLGRISANMGAGANKTAIDAFITAALT